MNDIRCERPPMNSNNNTEIRTLARENYTVKTCPATIGDNSYGLLISLTDFIKCGGFTYGQRRHSLQFVSFEDGFLYHGPRLSNGMLIMD